MDEITLTVQLHDVKVHWLEREMSTAEKLIWNALLLAPVEDAVQLHDINVHWLELEMAVAADM